MTDKQQIEPLTQEEIIRLEPALFEVLQTLASNKRERVYNDICRLWDTNSKDISAVEDDIRNIFTSEDTEQIKRLVCAVYDFLYNDRQNAYDTWHKWTSDYPMTFGIIPREIKKSSLINACRLADEAVSNYLTTIETALKNSPNYFFNGKFIIKRPAGVQEVTDGMKTSKYDKVNSHIKSAEAFLQFEKPLYKESMKASIDALELFIFELTGEKDIKQGINSLKRKDIELHPAFREAMKKLYDFTSDEVRHPKLNPVQNDEDTALFMLVICSAIIHFIENRMSKKDSK